MKYVARGVRLGKSATKKQMCLPAMREPRGTRKQKHTTATDKVRVLIDMSIKNQAP